MPWFLFRVATDATVLSEGVVLVAWRAYIHLGFDGRF